MYDGELSRDQSMSTSLFSSFVHGSLNNELKNMKLSEHICFPKTDFNDISLLFVYKLFTKPQ